MTTFDGVDSGGNDSITTRRRTKVVKNNFVFMYLSPTPVFLRIRFGGNSFKLGEN